MLSTTKGPHATAISTQHGQQPTVGAQNAPHGFDERSSSSSVGMLGPLQRPSTHDTNYLSGTSSTLGYRGIPISEMPRPRSSPYEAIVLSRPKSKNQVRAVAMHSFLLHSILFFILLLLVRPLIVKPIYNFEKVKHENLVDNRLL